MVKLHRSMNSCLWLRSPHSMLKLYVKHVSLSPESTIIILRCHYFRWRTHTLYSSCPNSSNTLFSCYSVAIKYSRRPSSFTYATFAPFRLPSTIKAHKLSRASPYFLKFWYSQNYFLIQSTSPIPIHDPVTSTWAMSRAPRTVKALSIRPSRLRTAGKRHWRLSGYCMDN